MAINWEDIERLAKAHVSISPVASEEDLYRQLQVWWAIRYTRPLKDPLLATYTLSDLAYEYLLFFFMEPENDPVDQRTKVDMLKEDEQWALKQISQIKQTEPKKKTKPAKKRKKPKKPKIPSLPDISTKFDE